MAEYRDIRIRDIGEFGCAFNLLMIMLMLGLFALWGISSKLGDISHELYRLNNNVEARGR